MNLTPEDKAVGQENFNAAIGSKALRRDFLQRGTRMGVASKNGLGSYYYGYGPVGSPVRVGVLGTGDEGSVLIGALNPRYVQVEAIADIRPYNQYRAFHGDAYSPTAMKVRPGLNEIYGPQAQANIRVYGDYRELLASEPDIEAVIIALPLHLHAPAAVAAMQAGKHVLTEKLMGHSVRECKEMARVAALTGKHLATGHQRHYNILYDHAVELIRSGVMGDLHYIRAQWHRGNLPGTDSWQQPLPRAAKPDDALAGKLDAELSAWQNKLKSVSADLKREELKLARLQDEHGADSERAKAQEKEVDSAAKEVNLWERKVAQKEAQISDQALKDAAKYFGYQDKVITDASGNVVYDRPAIEELIRWRLWDRTGGGLMAELGSHQLDAASIFIAAVHGGEKQRPLSVAAASNRPIFPPDRDVDDHVYCLFEFPAPGYDPNDPVLRHKKIGVAYASINGNGWGGYGETVFGTQGTLLLERESEAMLWKTDSTSGKTRVKKGDPNANLEIPDDGKGDPLSASVGLQGIQPAERGYAEEIEHWAWCIRENPKNEDPDIHPRCYPKVALGDAVIALTTNMAARKGARVEFQPEWFDADSDATPEGGEAPNVARYA